MPYLTLDQITQFLFVLAGISFLVAAGTIIYCLSLLLEVRRLCRALLRKPEIARDANGRPIKERI
jgi:hypothetical protein